MADTTIIQFKDVTKRYDDQTVLDQVSFEIERGKFYTLLGPSGCGKTTILRLIAGFSEATEGDIIFDGKRINDVPANKRQVNTVFQDYALFPHLNVFENIAFGLRINGKSPICRVEYCCVSLLPGQSSMNRKSSFLMSRSRHST